MHSEEGSKGWSMHWVGTQGNIVVNPCSCDFSFFQKHNMWFHYLLFLDTVRMQVAKILPRGSSVPLYPTYHKISNIRHTLIGNKIVRSLRCRLSFACRRCTNYIFILDLTPGLKGLGKDNFKMRQVRYLMRGINGEKLGLKCLNVGKILTI